MVTQSSAIERRKSDHIRINLHEDVQTHDATAGFERYRFVHQALPEINLDEVDARTSFLGFQLQSPILISSMTGGVEEGCEINRRLARAAQAFGCAMGVGSQRAALEDPLLARFYEVRDVAPDILLFANVGAIQLNLGYGVDQCRRAVEMIDANALILHLNPLQEALQVDGDRDFRNLLGRIAALCASLEVPVIVKEVGWGISERVAAQLANAGVAAIDVSGAGGTSWSKVEGLRAPNAFRRGICEAFHDWGIPTLPSLQMVRHGAPDLPVIASGGLRTGVDAAKAIAFGAGLAGFAGPLLRAAAAGEEAAHELLSALHKELRIAMFCAGAPNLAGLREVEMFDLERNLVISPHALESGPGAFRAVQAEIAR